MAVQFIVGTCGTGKTGYIYENMIAKSMRKDHGPIIYILPEQSNMIAEQDMVLRHPKGGTMDISILSFSRLAFQVFDKGNVYTGDILDDYGKNMMVMKVLKEHAEELSYYKNMIDKQGFVDEVKSIISEFYQYGVTADMLNKMIESMSDTHSLYYKINDLRVIYQYFEEAMGSSFMTAEQLLSLLADNLEESKLLQGAEVYFDGFTGFTPVQYKVIERMMKVCSDLYFSIIMDEKILLDNSYQNGLFCMGKETQLHLTELAQKNGVKVLSHVAFEDNYRLKGNDELLHLEQSIFRYPIKEYVSENNYKSSATNLSAVNIMECDDINDEIICVGRMIRNLVMDKGYSYRDIAVITGDIDDNIEIWKRTMEQMEIPYFTDSNEKLMRNIVADIVNAVIDLFEKDFSFDSVFSFLKTGFTDVKNEDVFILENYAMKYGVHGYSWWSKPFKGNMKNLGVINDIRRKFMDSISGLVEVFSKKEGMASEYILSLYSYISTNKLGEKLWYKASEYEKNGNNRKEMAYRQAYGKFISVLDKTKDILGNDIISRKTFGDVLFAGVSDISLGIIPSTLDQVVIGDIERTRLHNVKVLFLVGANEGVLPKPTGNNGILTDRDRISFKEHDIILAPDKSAAYYIQQFYLYMQMNQTSEILCVSYRKSDRKGGALNVSFFVKMIMKMFPQKNIIRSIDIKNDILPSSREDMIFELAQDFSTDNFDDSSLYKILSTTDENRVSGMLDGYMYMNQPGVLNEAVSKKLYGNNMIHSVSRLEKYAACEYQFFLQYGLKLKKPDEYTVENNHIGTILHAVMEDFFKEIKENDIKLPVSDEYINEKVELYVDRAADDIDQTIFDSSYRMKHIKRVINRIAKRSVRNLVRQLESGDMMPEYFEKEFSPEDELSYINMSLKNDVLMGLKGFIDRVDIKETENEVYVKIIDYKSGDKDIDYVKITEGKQLQLTVYMSVMLELLKKKYPSKRIIPTGMYYFQLADKIVEGVSDEDVEAERIKKARMKGLVNEDEDCLQVLDHKTGVAVPVSFNKDGNLSSVNSHTVSEQELMAISRYTREKMIELGDSIISGNIEMKPQKGELSSPCNYCDYRSVCRFEAGLGGNQYGIGSNLTKEEARKLIMGEEA